MSLTRRGSSDIPKGARLFGALLLLTVFFVRLWTSGPAYYQDSPRHLRAIANHTYVIQPPGYWLFTRIGSLFANPELGLSILNWSFSALGCAIFYFCARKFIRSPLAELGSVLYASLFTAWFSGDIQSTYASQLLFAPLTFYLMLCFFENPRNEWIIGIAASFALGAGLRPSDGLFLLPLVIGFGFRLTRKQQLILGSAVVVFCTLWLIPNELALKGYKLQGDVHATASNVGQLSFVAQGAILYGRLNSYTVSNGIRFFLGLALCLGPSALYMFRERSSRAKALWLWVLPGSAFFLLVYISDALYLNCILGGYVLLCLIGMDRSKHPTIALALLCCSISINVLFFLCFQPLPAGGKVSAIVNKDLGNFSLYGIRHKRWIIHLIDVPSFGSRESSERK
jgi:hypothetical protein